MLGRPGIVLLPRLVLLVAEARGITAAAWLVIAVAVAGRVAVALAAPVDPQVFNHPATVILVHLVSVLPRSGGNDVGVRSRFARIW